MSLTLTCPRCERPQQPSLHAAGGGAVLARCRECAAVIRIDEEGAAEPVPPPPDPAEAGDTAGGEGMRCPKCETVQPEAEACRSCGLLADKMAAYRADDHDEAELTEPFRRLQASWDDDAAHERFRRLVVEREAFAAAARLYRRRARDGDPRARQEVERMATMAAAMMSATAGERRAADTDEEPFRNVLVMLLILVIVGIIAGVYAFATWNGQVEGPPPPPPARRAP